MAPLFSKADLNKFWHDVQNEGILICAKFGKDLFSISKVIGRKTKWPGFFGLPCILMNRRFETDVDSNEISKCQIPENRAYQWEDFLVALPGGVVKQL